MEHEGGKHAIESGIRIWKAIRKSAFQLDRRSDAIGFASRTRQGLRIRIDSRDVCSWIELVNEHHQRSCAAADVQNMVARLKLCLIEKHPSGFLTSHQFYAWIVQWQKHIVPCRRKKSPAGILHRCAF